VLRVAEVSGRREPAVSYRLDGLMARVMDQDLLPVLLTLRALMPPDEGRDLYYAWPGLEFEREDEIVEVDLLTSDGENVVAAEVKSRATGLDRQQLDRLLTFCEAMGAKPCIAAPEDTFDTQLAQVTQHAGGRVLHGPDLLR
jgi:Archaeal holliday junction resolvase (hjc)